MEKKEYIEYHMSYAHNYQSQRVVYQMSAIISGR